MPSLKSLTALVFLLSFALPQLANAVEDEAGNILDLDPYTLQPYACKKADRRQIAEVNAGNAKTEEFLEQCRAVTNSSSWCAQLIRPNPDSIATFKCTYGENQVHRLIPPDEGTWDNAFAAVSLIQGLQNMGIKPCLVYNWWRPEPYNSNVGGAAARHPFGTSVDVRFCSKSDMEKAFSQLCKWRSQGRLRAVGYYGTTALHLGIKDRVGNTWGKSCP